jgi:hypothetical protein
MLSPYDWAYFFVKKEFKMKKFITYTLFLITSCAINIIHAKQYDYSCNTVYPSKVYCPEGYTCTLESVTCYALTGLGKALVEDKFSLPIKDNEFIKLGNIDTPTKLNLQHLPSLGKYVAYQFTGSEMPIPTPVQIVLRTESATPELLKLLQKVAGNVDHLKDKQITVWYRRLPQWNRDNKFEIHHYTGSDNAEETQLDIIVTPQANLQVIKPGKQENEKEIFEIATGEVIQ